MPDLFHDWNGGGCQRAKASNRTLTESEVAPIVRDLRSEARS